MGREGLEPPYCKANTTICVQTGFTVQRRYLPRFAVARGIEPLFEPAMPPVLPLDDTTEKLLSHKVSLAAPPSFDYRVQTYQKHHAINASVPWALCGFVPYPGIGPGYSQIPLWATCVSSPLNDRFLLSRPITSVRHQFGVQYTPTVPYGKGFQVFRTSKETPIGFMCSTNCRGHRGDLNPILHSARVACFQVTLPGP